MISCCIPGCRSECFKDCGISFHRKEPVVCSKHFKKEDYKAHPSTTKYPILKNDAVPSLQLMPSVKRIEVLNCSVISHGISTNNKVPKKPAENVVLDKPTENVVPGKPTENIEAEEPEIKRRRTDTSVQTMPFHTKRELTLEKKIKNLNQLLKRRDSKIVSLQTLLSTIKIKCKNFEEVQTVLTGNFQNIHKQFNLDKHNNGIRYSGELKQFALTLYYYSVPAYNLLRDHVALPHPATLRKILSTAECNVGFMKESFEFLQKSRNKDDGLSDVALIFDGMSIKSEKVMDRHSGKYVGYIDYAGIVPLDAETLATEVLVFQIVSLKKKFKCPVGYFFTNKITASIQSELILTAIRMLDSVNINVRSLTCDGTVVNRTTYEMLGCDFTTPDNMETSFKHPLKELKVHCILDPPHMVKLARNVFAEAQITSNAGIINFSYVKDLHELQKEEGLLLANKLCDAHINFLKKKKNVRLATQLLSSSVADAIEFLDKSGHPKFIGSDATVEYIRMLDRVFDLMNAKDPRGNGFKSPLREENKIYWTNVLKETREYLVSLKIDNEPILSHSRKVFALGLVMNTFSFKNLALDLLSQNENIFKYFLPYKCSQDHLEMLFSCVRARGGANDNPNALQFRYILRKLLFQNSVKPSIHANCTDADDAFELSPIVEFRSAKRSITRESEPTSKTEENQIKCLMNHIDNTTLSDLKLNILYYVTGYIVNNLSKKITCDHCHDVLLTDKSKNDHSYTVDLHDFSAFTTFVDRGALKYVAKLPFEVIKYAEKLFTVFLSLESSKNMARNKLVLQTMQHFSSNLRSYAHSNNKHPQQPFETEDAHEMQLVKALATNYCNLRMTHHAKTESLRILGANKVGLRQKLKKTVLFSNV